VYLIFQLVNKFVLFHVGHSMHARKSRESIPFIHDSGDQKYNPFIIAKGKTKVVKMEAWLEIFTLRTKRSFPSKSRYLAP